MAEFMAPGGEALRTVGRGVGSAPTTRPEGAGAKPRSAAQVRSAASASSRDWGPRWRWELLEVADGRPYRLTLRQAEQGDDLLAVEGHGEGGQPLMAGSLGRGALLGLELGLPSCVPLGVVGRVVGLQTTQPVSESDG